MRAPHRAKSARRGPRRGAQQFLLVALRTLIGWHFLYEGYFKLATPGWGADGLPLSAWSSAGYLRAATGPFASVFHAVAASPWLGTIDIIVAASLAAVGIGLMLGLFTQIACAGGIVLLTLFYVSSVPLDGLPAARQEGAYLIVNKTLIELAALAVVFVFRTGPIAGLDQLRAGASRARQPAVRSSGAAA
jgi:thiosulfate dehydrogenase [quinone] large subunit